MNNLVKIHYQNPMNLISWCKFLFYLQVVLVSFLFTIGDLNAQKATLKGVLSEAVSHDPLIAATIKVGATGVVTDFNGAYQIELEPGTYQVVFSYVGFKTQTQSVKLAAGETIVLDVALEEATTILQTATVTSGKYEKPLGEVTVSLEVIRPDFVSSTNSTSIDNALDKVPGVTLTGRQANIRGGSGYSYGAGSRVLLLVDDIPILQPDAGFPNWDDVPVENIEQVEIIKGAASSLYGSSAMNGIINIRTGYAKSVPETKVAAFYTSYFSPEKKELAWWDKQPRGFGFSALHKQKFNKFDLVLGGYYLNDDNHNQATFDKYGRFNFKTRYRINDKLSVGINGNFNKNDNSNFFYWQGIDNLLQPAERLNINGENTIISTTDATRYSIDPFITYFDNKGNRHKFLGRYFNIDNQNSFNRSNRSNNVYAEYQFSKNFENFNMNLNAGVVGQGTSIKAELYGDTTFTSNNLAFYTQIDKKLLDRLNISLGFRYEYNRLINPGFTYFDGLKEQVVAASEEEEAKPVYRLGLNYQIADYTYFRSSWGQGYRYPTVAEKFISTNIGVPISPNPALSSETGWSAEVGFKQGFKVSSFEGFIDFAVFWSEYQDMMEFTFVDVFPTGFQSQNVGDTKIQGAEISIVGRGELFGLPTTLMTGYTRLDPKFKEFDNTPIPNGEEGTEGQRNARNSSVDYNILKYRSRHSIKLDVETNIQRFSVGINYTYNSRVEAIDRVFELLVVPDLTTFREEYDQGYHLYNLRVGYQLTDKAKLSLLLNNAFNATYSTRPGLIEAPTNLTAKADYSF